MIAKGISPRPPATTARRVVVLEQTWQVFLLAMLVSINATAGTPPGEKPTAEGFIVEPYANLSAPSDVAVSTDGSLHIGRRSRSDDCCEALALLRVEHGGGLPESRAVDPLPDPAVLAVDTAGQLSPAGSVLVAGRIAESVARIDAVTPDDQVLPVCPPGDGLVNPVDLAFDDDVLLVLDAGQLVVSAKSRANPQAVLIADLPASPRALAVAGGRIYVALLDGRVGEWDRDGSLLNPAFATDLFLAQIVAAPAVAPWDGGVVAIAGLGPAAGELLHFDSNGQRTTLGTGFDRLSGGLAFGPDLALYVARPSDDEVLRVLPGRALSSSCAVSALPLAAVLEGPATLSDELAALNQGPPAVAPELWEPVACADLNSPSRFRCAELLAAGGDPLEEAFVEADEPLVGTDEITLDNCSSAFYRLTFEVPATVKAPCLLGVANVDDQGVVFLSGTALSSLMVDPGCEPAVVPDSADPCYMAQDTGNDWLAAGVRTLTGPTLDPFGTRDVSLFLDGSNQLDFAVAGNAAPFDPTGVEFAARVLESTEQPLPDLMVTAVTAPPEAIEGQQVEVRWRVTNAGFATAVGPWNDRVYLSADEVPDATDELLGELVFQDALEAGEYADRQASFRLPREIGERYVVIATGGQVSGAAMLNELPGGFLNVAIDDLTVNVLPLPLPDLEVEWVDPPPDGSIQAGTEVDIRFRVRNRGEGPTEVRFWTDRVLLAGQEVWRGDNPRVLVAGDFYEQQVRVMLPPKTSGTFELQPAADALDQVPETDEQNNSVRAPIDVVLPPQPDIVVEPSTIIFPQNASSARSFEVQWSTRNIGAGRTVATTWLEEAFLSRNPNPVIDVVADFRLGSWIRQGERLGSQESDPPRSLSSVLPADLFTGDRDCFAPGPLDAFYVKIRTDAADDVCEIGGEQNNVAVASRQLCVTLNPAVDLKPTGVNVTADVVSGEPSTAVPGHPIEVSWTVENAGAPPLDWPRRWQDRVYLSVDTSVDPGIDRPIAEFSRSTVTLGAPGPKGSVAFAPDPYTQTTVYRLPYALKPGEYRAIVVVDAADEVFEGLDGAGDANNVAVSAPFTVARLATDLVVNAATLSVAAARAAQPMRVTWQVRNNGAVRTAASLWRDAVYFSTDEVLGTDDIRLARVDHRGVLESGSSYSAATDLRVPLVGAGTYHLIVVADAVNDVREISPGETNNTSALRLEVTDEVADLAVTELTAPAAAGSGETIEVNWVVRNGGTAPTNRRTWTDRLYLSADDQVDGSDLVLKSAEHDSVLDPGESYSTTAQVVVPRGHDGTWHLLLRTDARDDVFEKATGNNTRSVAIDLEDRPVPAARLRVTRVNFAGEIVSGQTIDTQWEVTNTGDGPTRVAAWWDSVFLSRDEVLSTSSDLFLGRRRHEGVLAPGASYTATQSFDVPADASGFYFLFVAADHEGRVFKSENPPPPGEPPPVDPEPPVRPAPRLPEVEVPPPTDLDVESDAAAIVMPDSARIGATITVRWLVRNGGAHAAQGRWSDSVFLSADSIPDGSDRFAARVTTVLASPLEAGKAREIAAEITVPPVVPGDYHVVVRTDVFDQIHEDNEANNTAVSAATLAVVADPLSTSACECFVEPDCTAIALGAGKEAYFELNAPEGETARVEVLHEDAAAYTELYVRHGDIPTAGRFDFRFTRPGEPYQEITIPDALAGPYYVLVRVGRGPPSGRVCVRAVLLELGVDSVKPQLIGDHGRATLTVQGSRLRTTARVFLRRADTELEAERVEIVDGTRLRARFRLEKAVHGSYDLVVEDGPASARLEEAVTIEPARPALLRVSPIRPPPLRRGDSAGSIDLEITNTGNLDAEYVFLLHAIQEGEDPTAPRLVGAESVGGFTSRRVRSLAGVGGDLTVGIASSIHRALAPGESATLRTQARAHRQLAGDLPVAHAVALFDSAGFVAFQTAVADALREAVLSAPEALDPGMREDVLAAAADPASWRAFWFNGLAAAGFLDSAVDPAAPVTIERTDGGVDGCTAEAPPTDGGALCAEDADLLSVGWVDALASLGSRAAGVVGELPMTDVAGALSFAPGAINGCGFCVAWVVVDSDDPNEKCGSDGAGDEDFVPKGLAIKYRVRIENMPSASGPAAAIRINDMLDSNLNPGSFRLGRIQLGEISIDVPAGTIFLQKRLDFSAEKGILLDVVAGVDGLTNEAFWILTGLDPATGDVPADGSLGILAVNDDSGIGTGFVEYEVRPAAEVTTGIVIRNEATVKFDKNQPIVTAPEVKHTVDAEPPESRVKPLPPDASGATVMLRWTGSDATGGSGIASFTIYASSDNGPFLPIMQSATAGEGAFTVESGRSYSFYSVAVDRAGNVELPPTEPDASTQFTAFPRGDANADGKLDIADPLRTFGFLFQGHSRPPCFDAVDANDDGKLNVADGVFALNFLFGGGPPPPAPGAHACGPDPTADDLEPCEYPEEKCPGT